MPLKYMFATRTRSARGARSACGVNRLKAARGWPSASNPFAPLSLRDTIVSISLMRRLSTLSRVTRMTGALASRIVMIVAT
jgi:hypothetical protein